MRFSPTAIPLGIAIGLGVCVCRAEEPLLPDAPRATQEAEAPSAGEGDRGPSPKWLEGVAAGKRRAQA